MAAGRRYAAGGALQVRLASASDRGRQALAPIGLGGVPFYRRLAVKRWMRVQASSSILFEAA
jgi:hypothetical protein